jgi:hypothetical protein
MNARRNQASFTLSEMIVSIGASVVVIGGLLAGCIGLQKALLENERRVGHYSDQRRLIDYVARDLRRALSISVQDAAGTRGVAGEVLTLDEGSTLVLTLPGYYESEDPAESAYDDPLPVRHYSNGADYGTAMTPASPLTVTYQKISNGSMVSFIRQEGARQQLVAPQAEGLKLRLFFADNARSCDMEAIYQTHERGYLQVISTFDQAMLRNPAPESFR